jgi:hypothetical protein
MGDKEPRMVKIQPLLLVTAFLVQLLVLASAVPALASPEQDEDEEESGLLLILRIPKPKVCLGSKFLMLRAELVNVSTRPIRIDKRVFWLGFSYINSSLDMFDGSRPRIGFSIGHHGPHYNPKFFVLKPGATYKTSFKYDLDEDAFQGPGVFEIETSYRQLYKPEGVADVFAGIIDSNKAAFEIVQCK